MEVHALAMTAGAAVLLVAAPIVLWHAIRRQRAGVASGVVPRSMMAPGVRFDAVLVTAAAGLSVAAAIIHVGVTPEHLDEFGAAGALFLVAATLQVGWAVAWMRFPTRTVGIAGAAISLAIVATWAWSRSVGLPLGDEPGPEAVGVPDALSSLFELLVVGIVGLRAADAAHGIIRRLPSRLDTVAQIAPVPLVGLVLVAAVVALGGGTHAHG